jgi:hypothetical protein
MAIGYRFVIERGEQVEALGAMPLQGDTEARSFAQGIIDDLMTGNTTHYKDCTMSIFHGDRLAARIPFGTPR